MRSPIHWWEIFQITPDPTGAATTVDLGRNPDLGDRDRTGVVAVGGLEPRCAFRVVAGYGDPVAARWLPAFFKFPAIHSGWKCRGTTTSARVCSHGFWDAFKVTWKNSPFRWLVASNLLLKLGLYVAFSFSFYINLFYITGGDKSMAEALQGRIGTMLTVLGVRAMPIATWHSYSHRFRVDWASVRPVLGGA